MSETKENFLDTHVSGVRDSQVMQMIERVRNSNFTFKDPGVGYDPNLRSSVAHSHFDYKGNPMEVRPKIDSEVRKDLIQSHFTYGSHPIEYTTAALRASASIGNHIQKPPMPVIKP